MIKISVIVPVYNSEKTLKKCLNSILNQTLKELEIILINDGSKDQSHKICKKYAEKDKRIVYINKKNEGCSIARNTAINIIKGKYITFVDSDDYLECEMYEEMYTIGEKNNSDIVVTGFRILDAEYNLVKMIRPITYFNKMDYLKKTNKCLNSPCNKLYKKELILENDIFFPLNTQMGEDLVFNVKSFYFAKQINVINKCYYNYYNNLLGAMNNFKKKKEIYISLNEIYNFFKNNCKQDMYLKVYNEIFISNGVFPIYGTIENLRCKKVKAGEELLKIARENIKKNYHNFGIKEKFYLFYREMRLKIYFLKFPIQKIIDLIK